MRFAALLLALTFAASAHAQVQQPPVVDPANDPKIREEINKIHQELSNMLRQQSDLLRTITPNAGIVPLNGMGVASNCINGYCGPLERLYGPGRTGLVLINLAPDVRAALKIAADTGVLVKEVYPDTPAALAGYKAGDVIVEFNKTKVPNDLSAFMGSAVFVKNAIPVQGAVIRGDKRIEMGAMRLTDQRVIPAPVMIGDLTPTAIDPREQPVASLGNGSPIRAISNGPIRISGNSGAARVERFDGVRQVR
ncbi:MAG TPA: PDZ domain-containing protein [Gemmataceae bacterium]|jgi:membrane-associated protease RseP (regulator of RpoE activity)|nr:PDZ domain-containing protein [Gemmataceae bacterium]